MSEIYEIEKKKFLEKTRKSEQIYKESAEVTPFGGEKRNMMAKFNIDVI